MIGWTAVDGKLGSIKKQTSNSFEYKGMVYNRSLINGFKSFTVNYSGAELYYTLTNYLMEDMSFDRFRSVTSGEPIEVPNNEGYFIIYNDDYDFGSEIESITIEYDCDASIDAEMIFNKNSTLKSARSTS